MKLQGILKLEGTVRTLNLITAPSKLCTPIENIPALSADFEFQSSAGG